MFCRLDLEFLEKQVDSGTVARLEAVAETPFKRLSYTEAVEILEEVVRSKKKKFEFSVRLTCARRVPLPVADMSCADMSCAGAAVCSAGLVGFLVKHQLGRVADMPLGSLLATGAASAQQCLTRRSRARR